MITLKNYLFGISFFSFTIFIFGCQENKVTIEDFAEYCAWVVNTENGLVKTKSISGIHLSVKYLPPEYLAYQELKDEENVTASDKERTLGLYKNNETFLLTIAPDEQERLGADIMQTGIRNYQEFSERASKMNFGMNEYVILITGDREFKPVLSNMENVYGLSNHRNISFVFAPEDENTIFKNTEKLDFVFNDEIFHTGISHFVFHRNSIEKIPRLSYFSQNG